MSIEKYFISSIFDFIFVGFINESGNDISEFIMKEGMSEFEIDPVIDMFSLYKKLNELNVDLWVTCTIVSFKEDLITVQPSLIYSTIDNLFKVPLHLLTKGIKGICFISVKLLLAKLMDYQLLTSSKVLVLCQRTQGLNDKGMDVQETVIPKLETIIKTFLQKMTGSDRANIEYMTDFDTSKPENKADYNMKLKDPQNNPEVKHFLDTHSHFYDLIVMQTCPVKYMDLELVTSILTKEGYVMCTVVEYGKMPPLLVSLEKLYVENFGNLNFFPVPNMNNLTFKKIEEKKHARVLVICQRKEGTDFSSDEIIVQETVIPKLETIIKTFLQKMTGSDRANIEYMTDFDTSKPENKADYNMKLKDPENNPEVKRFLDTHSHFYDLIVMQTCPVKSMNLELIVSVLKKEGYVMCTIIQNDGRSSKLSIENSEFLMKKFGDMNFFPLTYINQLTFQFKDFE